MTLLETLREVNQQVVAGGDYSNYYVAKYDSDFNLIGYYANRNQAVRHHFQKKGLSHKSIILKYLTWNVSLRNAMELGRLWYGNYYMYMAKYKQPLIEVENAPMSWGGEKHQESQLSWWIRTEKSANLNHRQHVLSIFNYLVCLLVIIKIPAKRQRIRMCFSSPRIKRNHSYISKMQFLITT